MSYAAPNASACIFENNLLSIRVVGELSFDDNAKSAKFKQNIGALATVEMNGLCVGSHTQPRNEYCELSVYNLFAIALWGHVKVCCGC